MNREPEGADRPTGVEGGSSTDPQRAATDPRQPAGQPGGLGGLQFAGLGFQFAASLVAFYYLGQWLDRRFGTAPVFLLVCMLAGAGASFYAMYTQLMRAQRRADEARRGNRAP